MSTGGIPLPRLNPRRIEPPPPPPGFVLDGDMGLGDIPPPPAGFVMETKQTAPAPAIDIPSPPDGFVIEPQPQADAGNFVGEGLKSLGRGAGLLAETAIKAPAGYYAGAREYRHRTNLTDLEMLDRIERGEPPQPWNPGNRSLGLPGSAADRYLAMTPEQRAAERQRLEADIAAYTPTDIKETALYKAGQGLGDEIRKALPVAPGWEDSATRVLFEGLGTVGGGIAAYGIGGPLVAGSLFTAGGSGEALDRALEWDTAEKAAGRPGASTGQIAVATILGAVPGATDMAPIETALGMLKIPTPFRKPIARAIGRVGGQAIVEGGQEGFQQLLQNAIQQTYDEDQSLLAEIGPNAAAGAGVGALAEAIFQVALPGRHRGPAAPPVSTEQVAPAAPPAPTVTPEPAEQQQAPAAQPPAALPEDAIEDEPARAISDLPQDEVDVLRGAGWTDEAILDMADEERVAAAEEARAQGVGDAPSLAPEQRAPAAASEVEEAPVEPPPSPEVRAPEVAPVEPRTGTVETAAGPEAAAPAAPPLEGPDRGVAPVRAAPDVGDRADRADAAEERSPIQMFDPRSLKVAPKRFQFRENTDAEGVAPTLKSVQKWRPERGNQIIVWQDKAGDQYVVDGHQRTGLARRLLAEGKEKGIQIPGVLFREDQGVSAEEATTLASLKNIAEGSASPIEAAKVLRAAGPERLADLPMPKDAVRSAVDLSKLSEEPFRMVVNGVVEPNHAKYVGRFLAEDEARQIAAMKALARAEVSNEDEAAVLVRRVAAAELAKGEDGAQVDMFGSTPDSTALEEVKIVAGAMRQLRRDKTLFAKVANEADRIEKTGSKIERDAAGRAAEDADRLGSGLDTIAFRAGPVRDTLKALASEVKNESRSLSEARNLFVDALRSGDEVAGEAGRGARGSEREDQGGREQRQPDTGRKRPEKLASTAVRDGPSWVIRRKSDGEVLFETFDRKKVAALNTEKYEAVPIGEYLTDLNRRIKDAGGVQPERAVATEEGADGKPQTVLPGAERISDEELARRRQADAIARKQAEKRIAPKKPQRAVDEGLFGEGDRQLKLFRTDGTELPPVERRALENDLRSIIGRVAGRRVRVTFEERINYDGVLDEAERAAVENAAAAAGASIHPTIGGYWSREELPGEALIAIATADPNFDPTTTAFHEAWHQVEMALLNDDELRVLQAEIPRLRAFAAREIGRPVSDPYVQNLPEYEVSAIAFQRYARMKQGREDIGGISIAVRRMFEKIAEVLRQVRATLKGRKIARYEDLFGRAYGGGYAARQESERAVENALNDEGVAAAAPDTLAASIPFVGPTPGSILSDRVERFKARVRSATDPARRRVQDRYLAIKRFQEKIEATTGIKITTPIDVYQSIRLYTGKGGEKLEDLQNEHIEPLIEDMRARKVSGEELDDYLYARHAPERNAEMAKINPDSADGSGMSGAEAQAIMDRIDNAGRTADFEALAKRVDAITAYTRRELVTAGLIDPKTALAWKTKYPNYVPLRGFDDPAASADQQGVGLPKTGRGFDVRGKEAQTALGRRSKADSPVAYVVQQAEMAIVRAEKNRTLKTVLRFAQDPAIEPSGIFKVGKAQMKRRINPQTGMVETYAVPPQFSKADNLFAVKIGGKTHWITVEDPGFARALRGVGSGVDNALARALLTVSHTYAKLLTQWNPEFVPTNAVRDLQTALVNVSEFDSLANGTRRKILKDAFTLKAIRGALAAMYGKQTTNDMAAYYDEFRRAGGKVSYIELNEISAIKKRIDRTLKAGNMRRAIGNVADLVGNLNTAVENGVRLSVYANLRKAGVEKDKAAFIARDLTTDFNLRGEWGPTINALYIFFNASIQGSFRIARAVARSKTAKIAVASIFAAGFGMEFLNALFGGGDDDDNPYDKIEDYEFERNMIIMLPGGDYIKLPLAYGYNVPYVAGQQLARLLRGKTDVGKAATMVGAVTMDSFNPIGSAGSIAQFVSPWMLDPIIQSAENKTFFGAPIMPDVRDEKKPLSETYWRSAPEWAKTIARELNEATGGNKGRPGAIDISPETIQHYAEFAGGGVGRFLTNAFTTGEGLVTGESVDPGKLPFVRRFYGKTDTGKATQRRYFDAWAEIDQAHTEQLTLKKAREIDRAARAREAYRAEIEAYGAFNSAQKARKKLFEARDAAEKIEDAAKRKERLDQLDEREQAIMEKALDVYRRAKGN